MSRKGLQKKLEETEVYDKSEYPFRADDIQHLKK